MILHVVQLCFALYATGDHTGEPIGQVCLDYAESAAYDVAECPGEVTTPADDWTRATCELSADDAEYDDGANGVYEAE